MNKAKKNRRKANLNKLETREAAKMLPRSRKRVKFDKIVELTVYYELAYDE
jgi:hypothetical protein